MTPGGQPAAARRLSLGRPLDLTATLAPLSHGRDPTIRLGSGEAWLAFRTMDGPATLRLSMLTVATVSAQAWGPGAERALDGADGLLGADDDPTALVAHHPIVASLARQHARVRLTASRRPFDALLPTIIEQKVTGFEAWRAYRALVRRYGAPAPGPGGLWLTPPAAALARLPYYAFHPLGLERRRADVIRAAALRVEAIDAAGSSDAATTILGALRGIGPWTVAEVTRVAYGDPDAVSVGDYHVPNLVAWALAGEPRGDDARMLELLEPYRGQRGRVQRLLELGGPRPPRYGPRLAPRSIATF